MFAPNLKPIEQSNATENFRTILLKSCKIKDLKNYEKLRDGK